MPEKYDAYVESIVKTTVGSVINSGCSNDEICKKKKSLNKLKEEIFNLLDVEDVVEEFRNSYTVKLKDNLEILKSVPGYEKKRVNKALADLKFLTKEVEMKHLINSNLESLSSYLARLKVTILTKDAKVTKKLLSKFLNEKDLNLDYVEDEIYDFSVKLDDLEKAYLRFIDLVNSIINSLEHRVLLNHEGVHKIDKLRGLVVKQKEMLFHVECMFKEICCDLSKVKECKKVLAEFGL